MNSPRRKHSYWLVFCFSRQRKWKFVSKLSTHVSLSIPHEPTDACAISPIKPTIDYLSNPLDTTTSCSLQHNNKQLTSLQHTIPFPVHGLNTPPLTIATRTNYHYSVMRHKNKSSNHKAHKRESVCKGAPNDTGRLHSNSCKLTKQQKRDLKRNEKLSSRVQTTNDSNPINASRSVYKRSTVYPSEYTSSTCPQGRFLVPADNDFVRVKELCYPGFACESRESFSSDFHISFKEALEGLDKDGFYQYDITQPAGLNTKTAKTYVTRCLVGEAGITYKYLGLRMFSIPWEDGAQGSTKSSVDIGRLNRELVSRTTDLLRSTGKAETGRCDYNLTLINRCFPASERKLKSEPCFKRDKCTVSWHADSSLEHFSSIAVYHHCQPDDAGGDPWRVALRVWPDAEGPTAGRSRLSQQEQDRLRAQPAIAVPLDDGEAYFLLDDFNHHHQHSVLAGETHRFASTHRVGRTEGHSYQWISGRCEALLLHTPVKKQVSAKQVRLEQWLLGELEFEWIRQFYIQGSQYRELHAWWLRPMDELIKWWTELNKRTVTALHALAEAAGVIENECSAASRKQLEKQKRRLEGVDEGSYDAMAAALRDRHEKREGWLSRVNDPIFLTLPDNCRPVEPPFEQQLSSTFSESKIFSFCDINVKQICGSTHSDALLILEKLVLEWKQKFVNK